MHRVIVLYETEPDAGAYAEHAELCKQVPNSVFRHGKITGAPVIHIVSEPPKPAVESVPAPAPEDKSASMGPLSVLGWGAQKER